MTSIRVVIVIFSQIEILLFAIHAVRAYEYNIPYSFNPVISENTLSSNKLCQNNEWANCPVIPSKVILNKIARHPSVTVQARTLQQLYQIGNSYLKPTAAYGIPYTPVSNPYYQPLLGRLSIKRPANLQNSEFYTRNPANRLNLLPLYGSLPVASNPTAQNYLMAMNNSNSKMLNSLLSRRTYNSAEKTDEDTNVIRAEKDRKSSAEKKKIEEHLESQSTTTSRKTEEAPPINESLTVTTDSPIENVPMKTMAVSFRRIFEDPVMDKLKEALDRFDRNFYKVTFSKLSSISPVERHENGISFVQSGLFLYFLLTALATDVDPETKAEIDSSLGLSVGDSDKIRVIKEVLSSFPESTDELKFRWSSRLVLVANVTREFTGEAISAIQLKLDRLNAGASPAELTKTLNKMVEVDSKGAMHDTFEEDELTEGARAILMSMVYLRARWRAAPTLLNGTKPFRDAPDAPKRFTRMLRINDIMRYANLNEWNAEAIEISYATPGLTLLLFVPRGQSLRELVTQLSKTSLSTVTERMHTLRVAATLPLYTLRMTLLLPSKLQAMGISRLVDTTNTTADSFRLSHAVQRLMFWAEAGRNAFKDDGMEWDETPELELVVDRPYVFYVRWRNITLMNGNFVL